MGVDDAAARRLPAAEAEPGPALGGLRRRLRHGPVFLSRRARRGRRSLLPGAETRRQHPLSHRRLFQGEDRRRLLLRGLQGRQVLGREGGRNGGSSGR